MRRLKNKNIIKTVLICPLDWGLGHAARCVPVIRKCIDRGLSVIIAADKGPMEFLKQEFANDDIKYIVFPWKTIRYQKRGSFFFRFIILSPVLLFHIIKEHIKLKKIIRETKADLVISDNRFGLWQNRISSVFITHQVFVKAPKCLKWAEKMLFVLNNFFISKFDVAWVPDVPDDVNLSGDLSHKRQIKKLEFIGILSRFTGLANYEGENPLPDGFSNEYILVMLSGPEPQRSILEEILKKEFTKINNAFVILRGKPGTTNECLSPGQIWFNHLSTSQILFLIKNAGLIICRSGYSTLMDLSVFNKKALLIPTPGQTEQEYLGELMQYNNWSCCVQQHEIDLQNQMDKALKTSGIPGFTEQSELLLNNAFNSLLNVNR